MGRLIAPARVLPPIGYVAAGGGFIRDDFGTGPTSEPGGTAGIEFTFPMNSQDPCDSALNKGETHTELLAFGPGGSDDFDRPRQFVLAVELQI